MRIGDGRVSTRDQNPHAQHDALTAAGCEQIFIDKASGKLARRPELDKALLVARRRGDQLVITNPAGNLSAPRRSARRDASRYAAYRLTTTASFRSNVPRGPPPRAGAHPLKRPRKIGGTPESPGRHGTTNNGGSTSPVGTP
jgi:hypothetical protein